MNVKIEKLDHFGRGIAFLDKICFIENTLPGELVEIEIINKKKNYLEGKLIKILEPSPYRIESNCKYSNVCGGCNLLHLSYDEENKFKEEKVKELVSKFAKLDSNLVKKIVYSNEYNYRNKVSFHGSNNKIGYYKKKSNDLIEIEQCLLLNKKINEIIKELKNEDIENVTIRTSNNEHKSMLKIEGNIQNYDKYNDIVDVLTINNDLYSFANKITTSIGDKKYYLSNDSFFQVNEFLTEKLYDEVKEVVKETKPNKVLDLYCGTGTIGIYVSDYVKEIIGVDYSKSNIKDAFENKKLNNLENIDFICDKVENVIDNFNDIDLIIVDPPRAGLDKKTIENITRINPKELVYVSCDPATLSRDLNLLKEKYEIEYIKPFNMFPKTYHVECVSVLCRKKL